MFFQRDRHALRNLNSFVISGFFAFAALGGFFQKSAAGSSLLEGSPFLPPSTPKLSTDVPAKPVHAPIDRFILRGISKIGSTYHFSIYDKKTNKARWVTAGDPLNGLTIESFDPTSLAVDYIWNGQSGSIQLAQVNDTRIPLFFVDSEQKLRSSESPHNSYVSGQHSVSSSGSRVEIYTKQARKIETTLQKIEFENGHHQARVLPRGPNSFASDDAFARSDAPDTPPGSVEQVLAGHPSPSPNPYKVSRRNQVHNPSGKKPSHMSFQDWVALNNPQP
jgi:hypothetical protein